MRTIYTLFILLCTLSLSAQVQIRESVPGQAIEGKPFRLQYTVNNTDVEDIELGSTGGLSVISGPNMSTSSSFSFSNGQTSQSSTATLTYLLLASEPGKYNIEPATITVSGKKYRTRALSVEVLPADRQSGQNGSGGQSYGTQRQNTPNGTSQQSSAGGDCFVTVSASKTQAYEQEAILVTFKVYSQFQPVSISDEAPELNGCHLQEIGANQQKSLKLEHYNGRNYQTVVWRQYLLFPQQSGAITIPAVKYEVYGQQAVRSMDPMDLFFGGGSMMREFKKAVKSPALELKIKPLPTPRPANFSGAVGQFTISSSLTPQELKVNDALTMRLVVSGTGNMKLIKSPKVSFPTDFEVYDPKIDDKTRITPQGLSGNKVFDYIAVPRHGGKYETAPVEFCFFDPSKGEYKTLTTDGYSIDVEKGNATASTAYVPQQKEDLAILAEDIRFIKRTPSHPISGEDRFFGSAYCYLSYLGSLLLFILVSVIFRRQIKANADLAGRRRRMAGREATRRLRTARKMIKEKRQNDFYDEALKALWGYVADRLNIDVAQLGRDNVADRLAAKGYDQEVIDGFLNTLNNLEFARYAPGDPSENMDKSYSEVEELINKIK